MNCVGLAMCGDDGVFGGWWLIDAHVCLGMELWGGRS